jgi:hypothetical protein
VVNGCAGRAPTTSTPELSDLVDTAGQVRGGRIGNAGPLDPANHYLVTGNRDTSPTQRDKAPAESSANQDHPPADHYPYADQWALGQACDTL